MTAVAVPPAALEPEAKTQPHGWRRLWSRYRRQRAAMAALVIVGIIVLASLLAPLISPHDPTVVTSDFLASPSSQYWLGTDATGHDVFSRLLVGARTSLFASLLAVAIATTGGTLIGLASGWLGGIVDALLMRWTDLMMAFPGLLMAMAVVGALGPGVVNAMLGLSFAFMPGFARLVRGQVLAVREESFVEASKVMGARGGWIVRKHIVPNITSPLIVQVLMSLGFALLAEGALSFLGLSIQPPGTSLGSMLQDGFTVVNDTPWLILIPGIVITVLATCFNTIADGIRDALGRHELGAVLETQA